MDILNQLFNGLAKYCSIVARDRTVVTWWEIDYPCCSLCLFPLTVEYMLGLRVSHEQLSGITRTADVRHNQMEVAW